MSAAKKKKKLIRRLRSTYRLSILKESSYEEQFSLLLTPLNLIILVAALFVFAGGLVYVVVALTPAREVLVPGYVDEQHREDARYARQVADSLTQRQQQMDEYLMMVSMVLRGEIAPDSLELEESVAVNRAALDSAISKQDSALRARIAEEDRFALNRAASSQLSGNRTRSFLFKPLEGTLSAGFDGDIQHYGIDLVAPANSMIRSVLDGTVLMASYTSDGGHVIAVQHDNDLISVYKHNSSLLKVVGDRVKAGESIAIIGNTGDHSDGPHLHFELWESGIAVDPQEYFTFDQ